jgi:uncharacterized membrane protein
MKKTAAAFFLVICGFAILFSCKHEIPLNPNPDPDPDGNKGICFENDILPIFQSNCAKSGCHDAGSKQEGYQLDSYANIVARGIKAGNAAGSKIYESMIDDNPEKVMPQTPNEPLTAAQKELIKTWINEGAKNTTSCNGSCDSSKFAYTANVRPILQNHCLGCHSGEALYGGYLPLDNYTAVKQQVDYNTLYPSIAHTNGKPMPQNGNKLSNCKIAVIRKWIEAGAPNN